MLNTEFRPFDMATHGLLSGNSFTMSIQGHLTIVEITPVEPTPLEMIGGGFIPTWIYPEEKRKKKYKIKVTILKDGKKYVEEHEVKSIKTPTVKDIKIGFEEQENKVIVEIINPKIKISKPSFIIRIFK
jgi:hypothetical protein